MLQRDKNIFLQKSYPLKFIRIVVLTILVVVTYSNNNLTIFEMKKKSTILTLFLFALFPILSFSQTYLFSNYTNRSYGELRYFTGVSEPDKDWYTRNYDDSAWPKDSAVIGYGYPLGKTGYTVIDSTAKSLYVRFSFTINNKEAIKKLDFAPDFDDGFIAYLNGTEIARVNADKSVQFPPYDAKATR